MMVRDRGRTTHIHAHRRTHINTLRVVVDDVVVTVRRVRRHDRAVRCCVGVCVFVGVDAKRTHQRSHSDGPTNLQPYQSDGTLPQCSLFRWKNRYKDFKKIGILMCLQIIE